MTIEEICSSDKLFLRPLDIKDILKCDPQTMRVTAKYDIKRLGFNASLIGDELKIPRIPFLEWLGVGADV